VAEEMLASPGGLCCMHLMDGWRGVNYCTAFQNLPFNSDTFRALSVFEDLHEEVQINKHVYSIKRISNIAKRVY
jgi:hypothetical protein